MELTLDEALQKAVEAHKTGQIQEAERFYTIILQSQPKHPDANHNLGLLAVSVNKADVALPLFKTALEANPKIEQFWLSYIDALIKEKQFDIAKQVLEQAKKQGISGEKLNIPEAQLSSETQIQKVISVSPSQAQLSSLLEYYQNGQYGDAQKLAEYITQEFPKCQFGWTVLSAVLKQTGRVSESLIASQKSVQLAPQDPIAHYNLGVTLKELDRLDEAEASYRQAIVLKPDFSKACSNLGITLQELGRLDEAEASLRQAIALEPDFFEAHYNLGVTLKELDRLDEAEASYRQAMVLKPDYAKAYSNLGITLQELGRLDEAEPNLRQAIALKPDFFEAHYNLGVTLKELGRLDGAEASYRQAIVLKPDYAEAHSNLGITLKELGRLNESEASYRQAISLKPDYAEAHNNLGIILKELDRLDESKVSLRQAIVLKPDYFEAHSNLGVTLQELGRLDVAEASYIQAIVLKPDYAEAHSNLGNTLQELGRLEEAEANYKKAIVLKPDYFEAYSNLGATLKELGKLDEAEAIYRQGITLRPDFAEAYSNLGITLQDLGRLDEAETSLRQAILLKSDYAKAHYNLGVVLQDLGRSDEAEVSYTQAVICKPGYAEAHNNLGVALQDLGKLDEAEANYKQAIKIKPDYAEAFYNLSFPHLLRGSLEKGFNFYESRLRKKKRSVAPARANLVWDGDKSLNGKHFVIYEEQGLGDIIQFSRFLPLLEQKGADITFHVKPNLHALLQTMHSNSKLVTSLPEENKIDFEAPLMSLPHLLGTSLETIPTTNQYIFADQKKIQTWGERVSMDRFKVGICWQGSTVKEAVGRSFPLSIFEGISRIPNVELISLHKGEGEDQMAGINFDVTTLGHDFDAGQDAFLDTAAVMMNCNLIITCDTSIAHVAGAIGRPTWLVLKQIPHWVWMLDRPDSPWYPTITLYRQKTQGAWVDVFDTIEQDLRSLLQQKKEAK